MPPLPTLPLLHALLLGVVQGITEYLPVSADAHVLLLGHWLGDDPELLRVFSATLQAAPDPGRPHPVPPPLRRPAAARPTPARPSSRAATPGAFTWPRPCP